MTITITDYEDEVFAIHQVDQQTAAYLGYLLEPHSFPAPVPETQPEEADAQVVLDDILTACRNEINEPRHGATTPYEDPDKRPGWASPRPTA